MQTKEIFFSPYIKIMLLHILLGLIIYNFKILSFAYSALIFACGVFFIIKNKNKNNEVLFWAGYVVAVEVFLRMTKGNIGNEFAKYCVIVFSLLGIYFNGFSKKAWIYVIFLILLIPGVIYGIYQLNFDTNIRKAIVFNLLGAICLGISSIYTIDKKIDLQDIDTLTKWMLYPIITMTLYVFLYNPDIQAVITGTDSNSATSGGFGPNQVSTIFGLGMFVAFVRFLFFSNSFFLKILHLLLILVFTYRGVITFSRGGVITGVCMILGLLFFTFFKVNIKAKIKLSFTFLISSVSIFILFLYTIFQTDGLILNRYQSKDALGREKESKFSGREELAEAEFTMFLENPFTGVGVGKNKEYREELTGIEAASHNEITRMLAEHGFIGIIELGLLFFTPIILFFNTNRNYIFLFSFYFFWLLTINHAAMRIAAPAFIYSLTLFHFTIHEGKYSLPRQ
ncbi:O-antigen ligase family protein [Flavobacterium sp.]|uniref:O-antigen ligase family protein n=1 Tax=Flavobacterium sp. TaxID=239 RepID=UPI003528CA4D